VEFKELKIGMCEYIEKTITELDVINFSEISLDTNPLHLDEEYAKNTIFKGKIVHGILGAGLISGVIGTKLPGKGAIYLSQNLKFLAPVRIGDTIRAEVKVIDLDKEKRKVGLKTICINQEGVIVIDGEAKVKL
jgi:enoyl-coA hydratase, R-specific